jgi:polysaccharide deacetylase 2 family uncharacterized protein YibQ
MHPWSRRSALALLAGAAMRWPAQAQVLAPAQVPAPLEPVSGASPVADLPAWRRNAVVAPPSLGRPIISFVIDDMGLNRPQSDRAIALAGPLTLSWMPYARNLAEQVAAGAARGHETMLHMPMEALGRTNPGPNALRSWLPAETNLDNLRNALDLLPGAVGLNQHEGSVASLSVPLMDLVMGELQARGLLFVDSVTIARSVAVRRAQAASVPSVSRDVFLDNSPDPASIRAQLAQTEAIARRSGLAIAIGHPRQTTMDVMEKYIPTLAARGFVLWPISAAVAAASQTMMSGTPAPQ